MESNRVHQILAIGALFLATCDVSGAPFPAAGTDDFATSGAFKAVALDGTVVLLENMTDPDTNLGRSDPHTEGAGADGGAAIANGGLAPYPDTAAIAPDAMLFPGDWDELTLTRREVHVEILDLVLTHGGSGTTIKAGQSFFTSASGDGNAFLYADSFGEVASRDPSGTVANDFPAESFFNICAEIDIPGPMKLYNLTPMLLRKATPINGFPPNLSISTDTYIHDPSFGGAALFEADGTPWGYLLSAGHGATSIDDVGPDARLPLSCPVSFTVDSLTLGLANGLPNQVFVDSSGTDPRLDVTVYVSRSGTGPGGARPGPADGSNALSGSFTGVGIGPFPDFVPADAITSFSYGRDGTVVVGGSCVPFPGNIYFSLARGGSPAAPVCFGTSAVGANVYASATPPFGRYSDAIQVPAPAGSHVLVVPNTLLGLEPSFGSAVDDEVTGLELKDEVQITAGPLIWFGTLSGPSNAALGGDTATIYAYPTPGIFEAGSLAIYAPAASMGLLAADAIDALVLSDVDPAFNCPPRPNGVLNVDVDEALFSLAPGSPTLIGLGASPADIFYTDFDGTFALFLAAAAMGLTPTDNIDAADVKPITHKVPPVPAVSEWGLVVLTLLALVTSTYLFKRRRLGDPTPG